MSDVMIRPTDQTVAEGASADDSGACVSPQKAGLGVVIVNYRTPELVEGCLSSFADQLEDVDARIVVVDNHSNDGSADRIAAFIDAKSEADWKARVRLVRSPSNAGFSGGNNLGLACLDAPFYLLVNSDARARPGAVKALMDAAARHPRAGVIGPRLEDEDTDKGGSGQISAFRFKTPFSEFLHTARIAVLDRIFDFALVHRPLSEKAMETDWVSFASVLIRAEALKAAGPMDEGYFMYFEDADYCRLVKRAGWGVVYDPAARFVHLRGGSSPVKTNMREKKRPPAYYYASRTRYFRRAFGPAGPTLANFAWLAGRLAARARNLVGRPAPAICEKEAADIWTNWRAPLGDRRAPDES